MGGLTIHCINCSEITEKNKEWFFALIEEENPTIADINQIIHRLICSKCNSRNVRIRSGDRLLFDTARATNCSVCQLPIPLPRLEIEPESLTCVRCADESFEEFKRGPDLPEVPAGMRGKCPACKKKSRSGIVVVYQNASEKNFFLGCSNFPKCMWSSDAFYSQLND